MQNTGEALNEPVLGTDMLQLAAQRSLCKVLLIKLQSRLFDLLALGRLEDVRVVYMSTEKTFDELKTPEALREFLTKDDE